jgi:hypothetical protein
VATAVRGNRARFVAARVGVVASGARPAVFGGIVDVRACGTFIAGPLIAASAVAAVDDVP